MKIINSILHFYPIIKWIHKYKMFIYLDIYLDIIILIETTPWNEMLLSNERMIQWNLEGFFQPEHYENCDDWVRKKKHTL